MSKNRVEVNISGTSYKIMGTESEEYIRSIAKYIDSKMTEISSTNNSLSTSMIAVLASINVADEYFKAKENILDFKNQIQILENKIEEYEVKCKRMDYSLKSLMKTNLENSIDINEKIDSLSIKKDYIGKIS